MTARTVPEASAPIQTTWSTPLTAAEWDELFPGILDAVPLATGGANVIMQLARPGVGYGVVESRVESGAIFKHPIKRARTTFTYLAVAMLGTTEEKLAYRQAVNRSHAQVYSTESSPVKYRAFDTDLQLWVAACLLWGVFDTMEKFRGRLPEDKADELIRRCQPLATTLQVRPDSWPQDRKSFDNYWNNQLNQIHIDDTVRRFLSNLVDLKFIHPVVSKLAGPLHRFLTTGFLPPRLREEMHLDWSPAKQRRFDLMIRTIGALNKPLPRIVRQAPLHVLMWDFRRRLKKGLPLV